MADTPRNAERLLSDEAMQTAFARLEERWQSEWRQSENPTQREKCWHLLHALDRVRTELKTLMESADFDSIVAQRREKLRRIS